MIRSPQDFISPGWTNTALSLFSHGRLPSSLLIFLALLWTLSSLSASFFSVQQGPTWNTISQRWRDKHWVEWDRVTSCISVGDAFLVEPKVLWATFATALNCSLLLSLLCTETPGPFSTELLPRWANPSLCCAPGLCFPRECLTFIFAEIKPQAVFYFFT